MKPLPVEGNLPPRRMTVADLKPLATSPPSPPVSGSNRRLPAMCLSQRLYPWLLTTSTFIAGVFCFLYITKPVILIPPSRPVSLVHSSPILPPPSPSSPASNAEHKLIPAGDRLPGDASPSAVPKTAPAKHISSGAPLAETGPPFEETNLRVQHVLAAESPDEKLGRLVIDVPVLYRSRNLRWNADQADQARHLLARLGDYQEKARNLRNEGLVLLEDWNRLMSLSIPVGVLRADSPSLPDNQESPNPGQRATSLDSTKSIQVQPPFPR